MKLVAFNGSARKNGNTAILLNTVLSELHQEGIETELVQICADDHTRVQLLEYRDRAGPRRYGKGW